VAAYFEYMDKVDEDEPIIFILLMWPLVLVMVVFFEINDMLSKFFRKFMKHKKDKEKNDD
jgi:hypothetical protein